MFIHNPLPHRFRNPVVHILALWISVAGCSKASSPAQTPEVAEPPLPITISKGQENLLLTYRNPETDRFETVESIDEVPEDAKKAVVVTDLKISPEKRGSGRYVHVADLTQLGSDGQYPVAVASRYGFELGLREGEDSPLEPGTAPVVVYSASWCGVCRKTKKLLTRLGVPFDDKDIEASRAARQELSQKSAQAGIRPGGVPVIDVKGRLMQGLDEPRLTAWLKEEGLLKP